MGKIQKNMMKTIILTICMVFILSGVSKAQDSLWIRDYQFGAYNQYDLRNSSTNAISVHRVLNDAFRKNIKPSTFKRKTTM